MLILANLKKNGLEMVFSSSKCDLRDNLEKIIRIILDFGSISSWTSYSDICRFYIELGMDPHRRNAVNVCLPSWQAANTSFKPNSMDKNLGASHTCENLCWCLGKNE
ncbi:hypothetical protein QL285_086577 [Trifolium repens]|nr:hypothetical protein QL285_086577 [Trifolium repens]